MPKAVLVTIMQLPTGDVSVDIESLHKPEIQSTPREEQYAVAIKTCLAAAIPKLAERMGAIRTHKGQGPREGN